jgi:hypothetical protein
MPDQLAERRAARVRYSLTQPTVKQAGVSAATRELEARALDYCIRAGHSQQSRGTVACRGCLQDSLMDRLGQRKDHLPPLVGITDRVTLDLDELLADGGRWALRELVIQVNRHRVDRHQSGDYTETAVSARIRDLRKAGRHIERQDEPGGAVYWMEAR